MLIEEEARTGGVLQIQELLRHPDDLANRLQLLKRKFTKESALVDAQLKTVMEQALHDQSVGLGVIEKALETTANVKNSLTTIDASWAISNNIKNYKEIKKISRTHQNFVATKELVEQFLQLNTQVKKIQKHLSQDASNPIGPADNLLFLHYQIQSLESLRNSTLAKSKRSPGDVLQVLNNYFRQVDNLIQQFEVYLWEVCKNTIALVKNGYTGAVLRLIKIIETEEKADEVAAVAEATMPVELLESARTIKSYRIRFFDVLRDSINAHINIIYETQKIDFSELPTSINSIIDDLKIINEQLSPRFPKKYNIFQFFVLEYHRSIYDMVATIISTKMEQPGSILTLLELVRDYYTNMRDRVGVGEELLEPRLLDDRENELILDYIQLVSQKLAEWLNTLLNNETADFLHRAGPPEVDGGGKYLLSGSVIVFQMFNQQIDVVAKSHKGSLVFDVVHECCVALEEYQSAWSRIVEFEYEKFCEKSAELAEGLPDYIVALANDCLKCTEFAEIMISRVESIMEDPFKTEAVMLMRNSLDGFMKIVRRAYQILIDITLSDIVPALIKFYCVEWYDIDLMRLVIGTFEDYCTDFQERMQDYIFTKYVNELQERFIILYLETLRNKYSKLKIPLATEKMRADLDTAVDFFKRYKAEKRVKAAFDVMQKLIVFIESTGSLLFLEFYTLWKSYPDIPLSFVKELLYKRDDLEKSTVKEVLELIETKVSEEKEQNPNLPVTLFSKFSAK
ncbi:SNARE-binding exocyst subunit S6 [Physocladia obscura]|uniref:SNARE-binding exocyst subunit S6 n=1 Tax=Physocladia obscura TaxID=109957 RepID=A0AAD5XMC6_9FUNG|nr:SNARE-binding exocyst subunit S6 [Physocladia obscura]